MTYYSPARKDYKAEAQKIAKRDDVNPKQGESKYGDVEFADPKNKKYPIDTAEHIRAAWNYINKPNNAHQYSAGDASAIKERIISAWKKKIDKDGPPSAQKAMADAEPDGDEDMETEETMRQKVKARMATDAAFALKMGDTNPDTMDMGQMQNAMFNNTLKAISETPEELRVANYIVLFGGRDLTGHFQKNKDGSGGEYFTPQTDLNSEYTKSGILHVDFEHGRDPDNLGIGRDDVMGYVDWKTATTDKRGVFVQRVLNRQNQYVKWLEPLIKDGMVGNSSEAISEGVLKADDGQIKKWPLRRDTLTVTPMEPRMISDNSLAALKALNLYKENKEMENNQEDVNALVEKAVSAKMQKIADEQAAKAAEEAKLQAIKDETRKSVIDELKKGGLLKAPAYNTIQPAGEGDKDEGVGAFKHWMQTGQENQDLIRPDGYAQSIPAAKAAWNVTTGGSGGFLVPDPLYQTIQAKRDLASFVRQAPVQHFTTPADHLLVPRESTKHTAFVLTAEAAAYDENEATMTQKDLILYKYTKLTKVSEEFLMYNQTNWDAWFTAAMGRAEAVTENTLFTNGSGTGEGEGMVTGATASALTIKTSAQLNPEDLTAMIGKLGAGYNVPAECGFLGANASKWYVRNAIISGPFAWATNNGYQGAPDFFGYNWYTSDDVTAYTSTSAIVLLFGNMSYYGVVEKPGMMIQRNPYLYMANGQVGIFASIFRGGGVLQAEALYTVTGK